MNIHRIINKIKQLLIFAFVVLMVLGLVSTSAFSQVNDVWAERWISCEKQINPNPAHGGLTHWISYTFDQPQAIATSKFWNANTAGESNMGARDVIIDYSTDGSTWITLGNYTFPKAPESDNYTGFSGPDFGGIFIKKILITINNTYAGGNCASLAEVRFNIDPDACYGNVDVCGVCDGPGLLTWYQDEDQDGLGNPDISIESCTQPAGYVSNNSDTCDNGLIGWDAIGPLFSDNGCNGCHSGVGAGGLNLETYTGIAQGGNYCGSDLLTGNTLINIISIDNYAACGTPISFPSMNQRTGGTFDAQELAQIQAWIDGGALEDCANTDPCSNINVTCNNNTITVSGLSSPISQLIVFNSNWQTVYECSGDCDPTETIAVSEGSHYVSAKLYSATWQPICEYSETVSCDGITDPCAGQGGDSDGDGICDNSDQCPNLANNLFGQTCDDANPNTINDIYDEASCSCQGTDIGGGCVVATIDCGFNLSGLSPSDDTKIFDENWSILWRCDPWSSNGSCEPTEVISNLSEGTYHVQACGETTTYTVTCNGGNPCDNQGGDSDGDGICDNSDQCPNLANNLFGQTCDDANPNTINDIYDEASCSCQGTDIGGGCGVSAIDCGFSITGLSPSDDTKIFDENWSILWRCDPWSSNGVCESTEVISNLNEGTYHVQACGETTTYAINCDGGNPCDNQGGDSDGDGICNNNDNCIDVPNPNQTDVNGNGIGDACESASPCDIVDITCLNNIVTATGLAAAPVSHLQVFNSNWQTIFDCTGDCNDVENVVLGSGEHHVIVTYFTANWQSICSTQEDFNCSDIAPLVSNDEELLFFQAQKQSQAAKLQWVINTDYETASFEIERAINPQHFEQIGTVSSISDSREFLTYHFNDSSPKTGLNYYRIKQLFLDGSIRYSTTERLEFDLDPNQFSIYPNPADEELFVDLSPFSGKRGSLYMRDVFGRIVYFQEFSAISSMPFRIETPVGLASGIYAVSLKLDGEQLKTEFVAVVRK